MGALCLSSLEALHTVWTRYRLIHKHKMALIPSTTYSSKKGGLFTASYELIQWVNLFTHTETREYFAQQVISCEFTGYLTQTAMGMFEVFCDQFPFSATL